jgi:type IV pilus assembly protein PilO
MATPAILDKLQKVPSKTRTASFFAFVGVLIILFIWQIHIPMTAEIKKLDTEIADLQAKIQENDAKIRKLADLKAEVKSLEERLKIMQQQLPAETEVSDLLRQIQGLVNKSGLTLILWRPEKRRVHPSGMYEEIPITVKLVGGYHNLAVFFDTVGKLTRIVNMLNVKMTNAKVGRGGAMEINVDCTAMTFAAVESKAGAAGAPPAATKQVR